MAEVEELKRMLHSFATIVSDYGGEVGPIAISGPITESGVSKAEKDLGFTFPDRFRRFLATRSGGMEFSWDLDEAPRDHAAGRKRADLWRGFPLDFDELVSLGFAGPEFWVWEQFTNRRTTMIDPDSAKASAFLAAFARRT